MLITRVDDVDFCGKTVLSGGFSCDFAGCAAGEACVCVIISWPLWPDPVQSDGLPDPHSDLDRN
ncbi:hypothetical protein Pla100_01950 [Neorhodopirellula pilleata]|uniref:Uncharacterized protein n=1 Tax=Neorhodopirellula pilleata TaxID=2714738 RepID=A0A5C6AUX5_9BACT|nr:hypothetical protein Pla100_01950 [Neorhodopirellula pilleata]